MCISKFMLEYLIWSYGSFSTLDYISNRDRQYAFFLVPMKTMLGCYFFVSE